MSDNQKTHGIMHVFLLTKEPIPLLYILIIYYFFVGNTYKLQGETYVVV